MVRKNIDHFYYFVVPFLIVGLSFGFTSFSLAIIIMMPLLLMTNRHTVGVFLLMYGGPFGGMVRAMYPFIPVYGLLLEFLGLFLLWDLVAELFKKNLRVIILMVLTLLFFGLFYLLGPMDEFATKKYTNMCIHGILMTFGYMAFEKSPKINSEKLTLLLVLASICMFSYVINTLSLYTGSLLDYNWFREQTTRYSLGAAIDLVVVGYQHIGMLVLFAIAIFLSQVDFSKWKFVYYTVVCFELSALSGCRQALFGVVLIIVLRMFLFRKGNATKGKSARQIIGALLAVLVFYYLVSYIFVNVGSEVLERTIQEGDSGREYLWMLAISLFGQNPIFGVGIGGFHAITGEVYPHNFIIELLCETGIVGLVFTVLVFIITLIKKGGGLLHVTESKQFYILIMMGIFVRVMVSSDMAESIELYSALFVMAGANELKENNKPQPYLYYKQS